MNPLSSFSEIKKQTLDCNVTLAFTLPHKVDKISVLGIPAISVPENLNFDSIPIEVSDFYKLISSNPNLVQRPIIKQQDTAAVLYSSGTTGTGKGVVLSHKNFIAMIELFVRFEASQYETMGSKNVYLAVLPMFHIYGLSLFVMGLLSLGSSIVVMRKFNADEMPIAIHKYGVTHFPVVPPLLAALTRSANPVARSKLKTLKQVSCGAASLSRSSIEDFIQAFPNVDFIQGYGMTESTAVGTRGFNTENLHIYSSVGLLAPNMDAKVVDFATGVMKGPGSTGELWLRGPAIMKGYWNNMEATISTIDKDGWLHTGDVTYFDQDGYLHIVDRVKEIIKYKGFQIAPAELEAALVSNPEILDAAVTAARDEEAGEIPVAFVVRRHGSEISKAALIDYVAKQVHHFLDQISSPFSFMIIRSGSSDGHLSWDQNLVSAAHGFTVLITGCTIQESEKGCIHKLDTKVCGWEDSPQGTKELFDFKNLRPPLKQSSAEETLCIEVRIFTISTSLHSNQGDKSVMGLGKAAYDHRGR